MIDADRQGQDRQEAACTTTCRSNRCWSSARSASQPTKRLQLSGPDTWRHVGAGWRAGSCAACCSPVAAWAALIVGSVVALRWIDPPFTAFMLAEPRGRAVLARVRLRVPPRMARLGPDLEARRACGRRRRGPAVPATTAGSTSSRSTRRSRTASAGGACAAPARSRSRSRRTCSCGPGRAGCARDSRPASPC